MDGSRFDSLTRSLAGKRSRRGAVAGLLGLGAGLAGISSSEAACPPGRVSTRGRCLCKLTGRPPVGGVCRCPTGQTDAGDGLGCREAPPPSTCAAGADVCRNIGDFGGCNGNDACYCFTKVDGSTACAAGGFCFDCASDAECEAVTGSGSICVDTGLGLNCASCARACQPPCPSVP